MEHAHGPGHGHGQEQVSTRAGILQSSGVTNSWFHLYSIWWNECIARTLQHGRFHTCIHSCACMPFELVILMGPYVSIALTETHAP